MIIKWRNETKSIVRMILLQMEAYNFGRVNFS